MDIKTYINESSRTDSKNFFMDEKTQNVLHGAIGLSTESGELLDSLKKKIYYGRDLDTVNIKEELGDIMWYMALIMRELDLEMEDVLNTNIQKLKARYGDKFSEEKAFDRDLKNEREILESN